MNNKFYDYTKIDFSKINYIQFIEKDPENPEHRDAKNSEKIFKKEYISCFKHKVPRNNLLLTHLNVNYNGSGRIQITTPVMKNIFGINKQHTSFDMCLSFVDVENDATMKAFYDVVKTFEYSQMAQIGITEETEREYFSQIKQSEEAHYDPYISIKLPFKYNRFEVDIYNKEYSGMSIVDVRHGYMLRCNIYMDKIQKYNGKYICKWKCSYIDVISQ